MPTGGKHNFPLNRIPQAFFLFLLFRSWMSDKTIVLFQMRTGEEEREFLPLTDFWGVWSQYHGVFWKDGYAIKLNIVMLEWSSTQLWSPDAIWGKQKECNEMISIIQLYKSSATAHHSIQGWSYMYIPAWSALIRTNILQLQTID